MRSLIPVLLLFLVSSQAYGHGNQTPQLPTSVTTVKATGARSPSEPSRERLPDGLRLSDRDILEVYVDAEGQIYKRRTYQGVVPNLNEDAAFSDRVQTHVHAKTGTKVLWIGFQQMLAASRVFIKTDRVVKYSLYKPNPKEIVIEFPGAHVPLKNNQRELLTGNFQTPVSMIRVVEEKKSGSTRVMIQLNRPVGYIYRQDGPYVFVDIER